MTTLEQLLSAARRQPEDLLGWMAVADLLEEQGDANRAEVLRLDLWLRQAPADDPGRPAKHQRLRSMLEGGVTPCLPGFVNSLGMEMRLIPAGTFLMGSPKGEADRENEPQQAVEITRPLYIGVHTVTVGQFRAFVEATDYRTMAEANGLATWRAPGFEQGEDHPVVCVSGDAALAFCGWLTQREPGPPYRLPTEAEWEYACRAGARESTPFHFGSALSSFQANFNSTYPESVWGGQDAEARWKGTVPVGAFAPNAFGLYQMHGNVWEWCGDLYDLGDPVQIMRGGGWNTPRHGCRAAVRNRLWPQHSSYDVGFRVARDVAEV